MELQNLRAKCIRNSSIFRLSMKTKLFFEVGIILMLLLGIVSLTFAVSNDNNGYIVTLGNGSVDENDIVDDSGTDKIITFWELPLWVQLSVIGGATLSTFAFVKYIPLLLGKIFTKGTNLNWRKSFLTYLRIQVVWSRRLLKI